MSAKAGHAPDGAREYVITLTPTERGGDSTAIAATLDASTLEHLLTLAGALWERSKETNGPVLYVVRADRSEHGPWCDAPDDEDTCEMCREAEREWPR